MRCLTATALGTCLLVAPSWAQSGTKEPPAGVPPADAVKAAAKKKNQSDEAPVPGGPGFHRRGLVDENGRPLPGAEAKMDAAQARMEGEVKRQPDPSVAHTDPLRGDHLFSPVAYPRPRRLAPGGRGVLHVVVTLGKGGNVVLPGSVAALQLVASGPLRYGEPVLDPAPTGKLAAKFQGRPVHEDALVFKVPVSVDARAAASDHPVRGAVRLFLHDGSSGDPQGLFTADVKGVVTVGAPLPTPVGRTAAAGTESNSDPRSSSVHEVSGERDHATVRPPRDPGDRVDGAKSGSPETDSADFDAEGFKSEATTAITVILGLVFAGAVVLLLFLRGK